MKITKFHSMLYSALFLYLISSLFAVDVNVDRADIFKWKQMLPNYEGFSIPDGAFYGICGDVLIVAGGEKSDKIVVYDPITAQILSVAELDKQAAFGASTVVNNALICIGGISQQQYLRDVIRLRWNAGLKRVIVESLPPLPSECAFAGADVIGSVLYVATGMFGNSAMNNLWTIDLSKEQTSDFLWLQLAGWKGKSRFSSFVKAQFNGFEDVLYIIGGKTYDTKNGDVVFVDEMLEFSPFKYEVSKHKPQEFWRERTGFEHLDKTQTAVTAGQSHILFFSYVQNEATGNIYGYHTITDTWSDFGLYPGDSPNSIVLTAKQNYMVLNPRSAFVGQITSEGKAFGLINVLTICVYMAAMVLVGVFFASRTKNTDDYFRGGRRIPAWVAGLSIFATMLSSITFLAIPAKIYATDWVFFPGAIIGMLVIPFVMYYVLPYFCKINAASAYEYLEQRFNVYIRLFVAVSFVIYQIGRMAIVMYLPAIALAIITPFSITQCVLIIGIISVIYCTMGGLEAVVWTDAIQSIILLSGALVSFVVILVKVGGCSQLIATAMADNKFHMINWDWSKTSMCTISLWVMALGSIGQNLVPYVSDQAIVQRYMSVSNIKEARRSLLVGMCAGLLSTLLFFALGTALYVYYKSSPTDLNPQYQTDAIFPMFISQKLPIGLAGLVVAGIFAAAQSTVSTSMNSISTVLITDVLQRFDIIKTQKFQLIGAKVLTFIFGTAGTLLALAFVKADIKSLWESFIAVIGLFGSPMCGLFLLGMFTKRVNGTSALVGALAGVAALLYVKNQTDVSFMLYSPVGILACCITGYAASFLPCFSVAPQSKQ